MKMQSLKFFLLFCFLFFMSTMLATGKVLPPEQSAETDTPYQLAGTTTAGAP